MGVLRAAERGVRAVRLLGRSRGNRVQRPRCVPRGCVGSLPAAAQAFEDPAGLRLVVAHMGPFGLLAIRLDVEDAFGGRAVVGDRTGVRGSGVGQPARFIIERFDRAAQVLPSGCAGPARGGEGQFDVPGTGLRAPGIPGHRVQVDFPQLQALLSQLCQRARGQRLVVAGIDRDQAGLPGDVAAFGQDGAFVHADMLQGCAGRLRHVLSTHPGADHGLDDLGAHRPLARESVGCVGADPLDRSEELFRCRQAIFAAVLIRQQQKLVIEHFLQRKISHKTPSFLPSS